MQSRQDVFRLFLLITVLVFTTLVAMSAQQSDIQMLTGVVSDANCGANHFMKNITSAECTRMCNRFAKYALVVGSDTYALRGHDGDFYKFAGQTVTVEGGVNGKTVTVKSVTPTKKVR